MRTWQNHFNGVEYMHEINLEKDKKQDSTHEDGILTPVELG